MSLLDDFERSGMAGERYVRDVIWDETDIPEVYFSGVRNFRDKRGIANIVQKFISEMVHDRKDVYLQRFVEFRDDDSQFESWLEVLQSLPAKNEEKQRAIARMFTRVIRGYTSVQHRLPVDAVSMLGSDPWENYVKQF